MRAPTTPSAETTNGGWKTTSLFSVLRERFDDQSWNRWPQELARREPAGAGKQSETAGEELDAERFLQFAFFEQWAALRSYCAERGIRIIGDVAIFVSYDSADVWTHPDIFRLNEDLSPEVVAGVPPDAFSETGQRWGNPLYDWDALKARGYDWWIERMRWAVETCDIVRLDHFRGFEAYWEIPAEEPPRSTATGWRARMKTFSIALRNALGKLPFIAEDLGLHHALRCTELRKKLGNSRHEESCSSASAIAARTSTCRIVRAQFRGLHRHPRQRHHRGLVEELRDRRRANLGGDLPRTSRARKTSHGRSFAPR